jgi:hypothetical protein
VRRHCLCGHVNPNLLLRVDGVGTSIGRCRGDMAYERHNVQGRRANAARRRSDATTRKSRQQWKKEQEPHASLRWL